MTNTNAPALSPYYVTSGDRGWESLIMATSIADAHARIASAHARSCADYPGEYNDDPQIRPELTHAKTD
ncbi:hypothetical protein CH253_07995 [Rhodococcus sp. 06-156-3C]|uniref:hypothetical protein n=1 Tax=Rhodococcus sp. 06-156-3C TaxID=2022486 RepID=UPI000B9A4730|nr:hypothetical protein [Rhodococcus sp. 06-156-3C]OZD23794.1 hypothetical protein CH253_07995 [Rhodococcus sp. 06-156-3C]